MAMTESGEGPAKETVGGLLGAFQKFAGWSIERPIRALFGVLILFFVVPLALFTVYFELIVEQYDDWRGHSLARQLAAADLKREGEAIDTLLEREVRDLRMRTGTARGVVRAFVFRMGSAEQIVGITDVFESMDPLAERSGIRDRPLPIEAINSTVGYMLADPDNPRCIARNRDEYDDAELRAFLASAGLRSSVACPIKGLDDEPLGILALSSRAPLERNPDMRRQVRDVALQLGGYWLRSPKVQAAISKKQDRDRPDGTDS